MSLVLNAPYPGGAPSSRLWVPSDSTSAPLVAWWKSDSGITLVGGAVDRWDSKVGTMYGQAEAASRRMTYNAVSAVDGKPEVVGGLNLRLMVNNRNFPNGTSAFSFAVVAYNANVDNNNVAFGWGDDSGSAKQIAFKMDRTISLLHGVELHNEYSTVNRWRTAIALGPGGTTQTVVTRNTGLAAKTAAVTTGLSDTNAYIGARPNFGDRYLYGGIREIPVWNGLLSEDDILRYQGYSAWDNSTVGDLPADHPYKSAAPTVST